HAALTLHRHHRNPEGEATALDGLGLIAHRTGDHHQSLAHYHQALALHRTLGYTYELADTLEHVGHTHIALGQREQAHAVWQEALELYREQGRDDDATRVQRQLDDLPDARTAMSPGSASGLQTHPVPRIRRQL
ncbi:MAG TPA: tetratricopeptide repeat protein, partial [Umezawaea sp.]|nr:tetratricopeptide repeat protein [Umezawaea sp.]